jgi:hypothetical protein
VRENLQELNKVIKPVVKTTDERIKQAELERDMALQLMSQVQQVNYLESKVCDLL